MRAERNRLAERLARDLAGLCPQNGAAFSSLDYQASRMEPLIVVALREWEDRLRVMREEEWARELLALEDTAEILNRLHQATKRPKPGGEALPLRVKVVGGSGNEAQQEVNADFTPTVTPLAHAFWKGQSRHDRCRVMVERDVVCGQPASAHEAGGEK